MKRSYVVLSMIGALAGVVGLSAEIAKAVYVYRISGILPWRDVAVSLLYWVAIVAVFVAVAPNWRRRD